MKGRPKDCDNYIKTFKGLAWSFILKRCQSRDEATAEKWLEKYIAIFANKLMPTEIKNPDDKPFKVQLEIKDSQYARLIQRESNKIISRAGSDSEDSSPPLID